MGYAKPRVPRPKVGHGPPPLGTGRTNERFRQPVNFYLRIVQQNAISEMLGRLDSY